ncbi:MAG: hypothetical protein M3440_12790, partial [Chloroflexota bacterium]|nr:hypothetical protein [Chloroflexota bacterium]
QGGRSGASGQRNKQGANGAANGDAVIEVDSTGKVAPASKPTRSSTSYQDRVAATKFGAATGKAKGAQPATTASTASNGRMSGNGASGNGRSAPRAGSVASTSRKAKRKRTAS